MKHFVSRNKGRLIVKKEDMTEVLLNRIEYLVFPNCGAKGGWSSVTPKGPPLLIYNLSFSHLVFGL